MSTTLHTPATQTFQGAAADADVSADTLRIPTQRDLDWEEERADTLTDEDPDFGTDADEVEASGTEEDEEDDTDEGDSDTEEEEEVMEDEGGLSTAATATV